jgi:hypothetical protein
VRSTVLRARCDGTIDHLNLVQVWLAVSVSSRSTDLHSSRVGESVSSTKLIFHEVVVLRNTCCVALTELVSLDVPL